MCQHGLGDVSAIAKCRFFKRPELGATTELAALFGVKLPTGRDDVRDGGMRLSQPLQPGSGSVDAIFAIAEIAVKVTHSTASYESTEPIYAP